LTTSDYELGSPGFASPSTFPSRVFSTPQGFTSRNRSGLISCRCHPSGFHLQSFSHTDSPTAISGSVPSWSYETTTGLALGPQRGEHPASLDAFDSFRIERHGCHSVFLSESSCRCVTGCGGSWSTLFRRTFPRLSRWEIGLLFAYLRAFGDGSASRVMRDSH
jgi:hypothetical protein